MYKKTKLAIIRLNTNILKCISKFDNSSAVVEIITLLLYMISFTFVTIHHEIWADELQSFMIARDATIYEMIFEIGHGEWHPALWWIILSLFAKNGFSAEMSLKVIAFLLNSVSVAIVLFKFKIHKICRVSIPFTYFLFYQYGVISRCYSITILGFCLLTLVWNERKKHPYKNIICMLLICASTAYGIVLMLGLAIIWVFEVLKSCIVNKKIKIRLLLENHKDETLALTILAVISALISFSAIPNSNAAALNLNYDGDTNSYVYKVIYLVFIEPIDALFFSSVYADKWLNTYHIDVFVFVLGIVISLIFWSIIFTMREVYGKRKYLIIPHLLFTIISSLAFFMSHHSGITALFFLFWIVTCFTDNSGNQNIENKYYSTPYGKFFAEKGGGVLIPFRWLVFCLILCVSIEWSISSSILEMNLLYAPEKEFINKINSYAERVFIVDSNKYAGIIAYKTDNINTYYEMYNGRKVGFTVLSIKENDKIVRDKEWLNIGYPDIVTDFSSNVCNYVSESTNTNIPEYRLIDYIDSGKIFKGVQDSSGLNILMRVDLADELGGLGVYKVKLK